MADATPVNDETDLTTLVGDNGKFRALVEAKFRSEFGNITWGDARVWTKDEFLDEYGSNSAPARNLLKKWMAQYGLEAGFKVPPQDAEAHTADDLTQQFMRLMSSAPSFQLTTPPKVSCRLWVGDNTVFSLPAPTFETFNTAVRSIFELDTDANISYYYISHKSNVHSRKYISDDHDLKRFHALAGKPTIFVWMRGESPSLSPDSLPSEIEIQALSVESSSDSSTSTRGHAQKLFRNSVRARDKNTCVLSGTVVREKAGNVQAAHIFGIERALAQERQRLGIYNAYDTQNGMLLETSLHTDFDAYLWCMDEFLIVHVSEEGKTKGLGKWEGKKLNLTLEGYGSPPPSLLKARYELFLRKAAESTD